MCPVDNIKNVVSYVTFKAYILHTLLTLKTKCIVIIYEIPQFVLHRDTRLWYTYIWERF